MGDTHWLGQLGDGFLCLSCRWLRSEWRGRSILERPQKWRNAAEGRGATGLVERRGRPALPSLGRAPALDRWAL